MIVVIDPGHDKSTVGAVAYGLKEYLLVYSASVVAADTLRREYGLTVYLTHTLDTVASLYERTSFANSVKADLLVSLHINSSDKVTANGTETFYKEGNIKGRILSERLQNEMIKEFGLRNRGVKSNPLHMTREPRMPSALAEVAFLSNPTEAAMMKQADFPARYGKCIAKGIVEYLGVKPVVTHWAEKETKEAVELGIIQGYPDGTYNFDNPPTRAETIVMLMRLYKKILTLLP